MLNDKQLRCGIYDSTVARRTVSRTPERIPVRYEIELYHTNTGVCYVDGAAYPTRRGMLLCIRPGQKRYSQLPIRSSYIWLTPDPDTETVLRRLPVCTYLEDPEATDALFLLFTRLHSAAVAVMPEEERIVCMNAAFYQILQNILRLCRGGDQSPVAKRLVREAKGYIDDHFCGACTLEEIAEYVHISANHLHTVFRQSEGRTPYEYVRQKRIERAKTLIFMGQSSLAQIALETGFCSQSHFSAAFKKVTGQTPAQYRKNLFDWKP